MRPDVRGEMHLSQNERYRLFACYDHIVEAVNLLVKWNLDQASQFVSLFGKIIAEVDCELGRFPFFHAVFGDKLR